MKLFSNTIRFAGAMAIGASVAAMTDSAQADVSGGYSSASQYNIKITHMPDFDQRRDSGPGAVGLPGNGGMYCVPTAAMNMLAYAANHGYPNTDPGPAWWQSQAKYNDAGNAIFLLGFLMGTDAQDGTNGNGASAGLGAWVNSTLLTRSTYWASGNSCPTITHITQAVVNGGIATLCYGRFNYIGNIGGTDFVGARTGGHCVTLSQATRSGSQIIIKVRDPADDPDWQMDGSHRFTQSPFTDKVYGSASQRTVSNFGWTRTMTALVYPPPVPDEGTQQIRLVDFYQVLRPKFGLTWQPGINNDPPKIIFWIPQFNGPHFNTEFISSSLDALNNVFDVALSADLLQAFVVGMNKAGQGVLQSVEITTGVTTDITPVNQPVDMVVGRKQEIYVLTQEGLLCINPFNPENPIEATVFPPGPCKAMCYDDKRDELHLILPDSAKILTYAHRFADGADPIMTTCIPETIPLEPDEAAMAVNPADGKVWFCTPASNTIYHVPHDPACDPVVEVMSMPEIVNPISISFDDQGHAYVKCDAGLVEASYNKKLMRWQAVDDPYVPDMEIGPKFYISTSRDNYDPDEHSGPEWNNVDPDEERNLEGTFLEIDCLADIVSNDTFLPPGDGKVDGADLAYMLSEWGPTGDAGSLADLVTNATFAPPEDGQVDGADLGFLLNHWGDCPSPTE